MHFVRIDLYYMNRNGRNLWEFVCGESNEVCLAALFGRMRKSVDRLRLGILKTSQKHFQLANTSNSELVLEAVLEIFKETTTRPI